MKPGPRYQCQECGHIIQSLHRHDYVTCKCGASSVDGGGEYTRLGWSKRPPVLLPAINATPLKDEP